MIAATARRALFAIVGAAALAGCASQPQSMFQDAGRTTPQELAPRPFYAGYGSAVARQEIPWTVDSLVADFIELNFETEGGHRYDRLLRWEGPVRIAYEGDELAAYRQDILRLIALLNEAAPGLRASLVESGDADIWLRTAPQNEMKAVADTALCFFTPVDMTWEEFKSAEARGEGGWDRVEALSDVTIFIPAFASPHTFRICFIEEIMQALGPGNDLYVLEDSGFNDDEVHKAPTAFDLLMIRTLYDEAMRPGLKRPEAVRVARAVIADALPAAQSKRVRRARSPVDREFQRYHYAADIIEDPSDRKAVVDYALQLATQLDESDHRIGEAYRSAAYYQSEHGSSAKAVDYAAKAEAHFAATLPADSARLARMRSDLGYLLLIEERYEEAAPLLRAAAPVLAANEMAAELASTLRLTAVALAGAGERSEAARIARQALDWGAYVFGADADGLSRWRKEFKDFGIDA